MAADAVASSRGESNRRWGCWCSRFTCAVGLALGMLVVMGLCGWPPWVGDLAAHFFVQYALAASVLLIIALVRTRWSMAALLAVCAALSAWMASLPWRLAEQRTTVARSTQRTRLLYANVNTRNPTPAAILQIIAREKPDIVVLVEASAAFSPVIEELAAEYPYSVVDLREHNDGLAILSRCKATRGELIKLPPHVRGRIAAMTVEFADGDHVRIIAAHSHPPSTPSGARQRDAELIEIAAVIKNESGQVLFAGDLNTTMWAKSFQDFAMASGLHDARIGFGIAPTWPSFLPTILQLPIDHVLHSTSLGVHDFRTVAAIGSDHLPVVVDFSSP